jgi:ketosteroid isomerase-like protein
VKEADAMGAENAADDLERVVERYHLALGEFMKGNPEPAGELFSERDDVTLGNPFGPFARGSTQVVETMRRAAEHYRDGDASGFDRISMYIAADLAYIVEVERLRSKVGGREDVASVDLRVTTIFRREDGRWNIVHRHADPITTVQRAESVVQET